MKVKLLSGTIINFVWFFFSDEKKLDFDLNNTANYYYLENREKIREDMLKLSFRYVKNEENRRHSADQCPVVKVNNNFDYYYTNGPHGILYRKHCEKT